MPCLASVGGCADDGAARTNGEGEASVEVDKIAGKGKEPAPVEPELAAPVVAGTAARGLPEDMAAWEHKHTKKWLRTTVVHKALVKRGHPKWYKAFNVRVAWGV